MVDQNKVVKVGNAGSRLVRFFKETQAEVKKVTWPDRRYVAVATLVVLLIVVLVSLFVMLIDFGFVNIFKALRSIF